MREVFTYLASSTPEGMAALRDTFAAAFGKAELSGAETAVIYEQSMSAGFGQSCRGYVLLRYLGYPKIRILHGGYAAWVAAGLPSTTTVPTPVAKAFPINANGKSILVDLETMKAAVKTAVHYQDFPSGMRTCSLCKFFISAGGRRSGMMGCPMGGGMMGHGMMGAGACQLVEGRISPMGDCDLYAPRSA